MRIAFHAPRASYLGPGFSGDLVFVRSLLDGLRAARTRDRGRLPPGRAAISCAGGHRRAGSSPRRVRSAGLAKRFTPEAWLVYGATVKHPDLYGWWQRPRRYVLVRGVAWETPSACQGPGARSSASRIEGRSRERTTSSPTVRRAREDPAGAGVAEGRLRVLPLAITTLAHRADSSRKARRRLGLPQDVPVVLCVSRLTAPKADGRPWKSEMVLEVVSAVAAACSGCGFSWSPVTGAAGRRVEAERPSSGSAGGCGWPGEVANEEMPW